MKSEENYVTKVGNLIACPHHHYDACVDNQIHMLGEGRRDQRSVYTVSRNCSCTDTATQRALIPDRADTGHEWVNLMSFLDYIINFDEMNMQSSYQQLKHELPQKELEHQSNQI